VKSAPRAKRVRATQAERRALTIRKLTDATVETLFKLGYARTTVKEICRRAKLSDGALFRFFPTLLDLILASAETAARRHIEDFETRFNAADDVSEPLVTALAILRDICRSKTNTVLNELLLAARTDPVLRRRLAPGIEAYQTVIRSAAQRLPGIDAVPAQMRDALVFGATHLFDREAQLHHVYPQPDEEDLRLTLLQRFVTTLKL
jgi:AcrR family transcriptional regulator